MASGLGMIVSYAAVIMVASIIMLCVSVIRLEQQTVKEERGKGGWAADEGIAWLTVVSDKRKGKQSETLKGAAYSIGLVDQIGSGKNADTQIKHPAVEKMHVTLTYKRPGKMLVKQIKTAAVSTNRREGELMDGDLLILGVGGNRIELRLSFVEHSDIVAATRDGKSEGARKGGRLFGR